MKPLNKFFLCVFAAWGLVSCAMVLKGSALSNPPTIVRQWICTSGLAALSIDMTGGGTYGPTQSVLIVHDTPGGSDVYINFNGTAAAPTSGGSSFTLKAGDKINIDGRYLRLSYINVAGASAFRVIASY